MPQPRDVSYVRRFASQYLKQHRELGDDHSDADCLVTGHRRRPRARCRGTGVPLLAMRAVPFLFQPPYVFVMNPLTIVTFAGLRRTFWGMRSSKAHASPYATDAVPHSLGGRGRSCCRHDVPDFRIGPRPAAKRDGSSRVALGIGPLVVLQFAIGMISDRRHSILREPDRRTCRHGEGPASLSIKAFALAAGRSLLSCQTAIRTIGKV